MAANILVGIVAAMHLYFLVLEMFLWDTPFGHRVFRLTPETARSSKVLAANQGLYNGFLAAGLTWGLALGDAGSSISIFFLACVVVAGVYGGLTVNRRVALIQAGPAAVALGLLLVR